MVAYDFNKVENVGQPSPEEAQATSYIPVIFQRDEKMAPGSRLIAIDPKTDQLRLVFAGPAQDNMSRPEFFIKAHDHKGRAVVHIFDGDYKGYMPAEEFREPFPVIRARGHAHLEKQVPYEVRSATIRYKMPKAGLA